MNFTYHETDLPGATPIYINSSALKLASCRRRFVLTQQGYAPEEPADSREILRTGNALHKFAELFTTLSGDTVEAARSAAAEYPDVARSIIIAAAGTRIRVRIPPPIVVGGRPAVEFKFRLPWYAFEYAGKQYQIVLCGTMDHIAIDQGLVTIFDYKSTRKRMADYALKKYEHSSQFAFYQWIMYKFASRLGLPLDVANLVRSGKVASRVVPILIAAKEPIWVIGPTRALSVYQFDEYEHHLRNLLFNTLVPAMLDGSTAADGMVNDSCQYCLFHKFCYEPNEERAREIFQSYPIKPYDPLNRSEVTDE